MIVVFIVTGGVGWTGGTGAGTGRGNLAVSAFTGWMPLVERRSVPEETAEGLDGGKIALGGVAGAGVIGSTRVRSDTSGAGDTGGIEGVVGATGSDNGFADGMGFVTGTVSI